MDLTYYKYLLKIYCGRLPINTSFDIDHVLKERGVKTADEINRKIFDKIISGKPFFAGRLGGTECAVIRDYILFQHLTGVGYVRKKMINQLCMWSGFFPGQEKEVMEFVRLMISSLGSIDVLFRWWGKFENYLIEKYTSTSVPLADLYSFEPWKDGVSVPWSAALAEKKVLVIHPFEDTIIRQYQKREKLWPGTQILPEFELRTLKAVQTIAGQKDERFETWFDALDYMYQSAMNIDFDVAIIGCGAYGFPLAAKLKQAGKQAIHLAGATQILFGIRGKRWEQKQYAYIQRYFNEEWCYPEENERPKGAEKVEAACYWQS